MLSRARQVRDAHVIQLTKWDDVVPALDAKNVILVPWCRDGKCEDTIKERSSKKNDPDAGPQDEKAPSMGAKSLCIPFDQPEEGVAGLKCIQCGKEALVWGLFGRSY
jgi:prolyl-tRNA synthetase